MKKYFKIIVFSLVVLGGTMIGYINPAKATVTVTPMLVLIEGRDRFSDVNLVNSSVEENAYAVEWLYFKQVEDSGLYEVLEASPTEFDLAKHIVYTPRRFSLKARGVQKIRLGMRLNGEPPPPGDYRAHLLIKKSSEPRVMPEGETEPGKVKVGVNIGVGFSIPVVYRSGESDATAVMGDITTQVNKDNGKIEVVIPVERRGGPFGLLGHMLVYHNDKVVGEVQNANIFSDIKKRTFVITLSTPTLTGGTLRVVYKDFDKKKDVIFAEKSISIGN